IDRRLKDRIAPALRAGLIKAPIIVMVTVTFWLNPNALAEAGSENATFELRQEQLESPKETSSLTEEALHDTAVPPVSGFTDKLYEQFVSIVKTMGSHAKLSSGRSTAESTHDYVLRKAHFVDADHSTEANPEVLRNQLTQDSSEAIGKNYLENNPMWNKLKSG